MISYCKKNKQFIVDVKIEKKKNRFTGKVDELIDYQLEDGKWYASYLCKKVALCYSELKEINLARKRKTTGKHFIRRLSA